MSIMCQVLITKEEDWYVAKDITSGVASQGKTMDESMRNLKEALQLFYENTELPLHETCYFTTMEVSL